MSKHRMDFVDVAVTGIFVTLAVIVGAIFFEAADRGMGTTITVPVVVVGREHLPARVDNTFFTTISCNGSVVMVPMLTSSPETYRLAVTCDSKTYRRNVLRETYDQAIPGSEIDLQFTKGFITGRLL